MQVEQVYVQPDCHYLCSGDVLDYTTCIYHPDKHREQPLSDLVYYQVTNYSNQVVLNWRQPLKNNRNSGSIKLPDTLSTGVYQLKAFTYSLSAMPASANFSIPLIIVRLDDTELEYLRFPVSLAKQVALINDSMATACEPGVQTFKANNEIRFNVPVSENNMSDSLVYAATIQVRSPFQQLFVIPANAQTHISSGNHSINLEYKERGFKIVEGKISRQETGEPIINGCITASYSDKSSTFKQAITDSNGIFRFLLDSRWDNRPVYFQVMEEKYFQSHLQWDFQPKVPDENKENVDSMKLNPYQINFLKEIQKRSLVQKVYVRTESIPFSPAVDSVNNFYGKPDRTIYPGDYYPLNNFIDICANIIPGLSLDKTQKGYVFSLVLRDNQPKAKDHVLVLLNGVPFFNLDYIALLSSQNIERIDVFNSVFLYGHLKYNGLVAIYTPDMKIKDEWFNNPVYVFQNNSNYTTLVEKPKNSVKLPAVGICIYRNHEIIQPAGDTITFTMAGIHLPGDYQLSLSGIDKQGIFFRYNQFFTIKP